MNILREVGSELRGMFWADGWLAGAILALVGLVAGLVGGLRASPLAAGCVLLFGCLAILVAGAWHAARNEVNR
jgi:hypothetical protein